MVEQEEQSTEWRCRACSHTGFCSTNSSCLKLKSVHLVETGFSLVATGALDCHAAGIHVQYWDLMIEETHCFLIPFSFPPVTSYSSFSKEYQCLLEELQNTTESTVQCKCVRRSYDRRRKCCHIGIATYSPIWSCNLSLSQFKSKAIHLTELDQYTRQNSASYNFFVIWFLLHLLK